MLACAPGSGDLIALYDVAKGEERRRLTKDVRDRGVEVAAVVFSPDGHTLASMDRDGRILLWDLDSGEQRNKSDREETAALAAATPDGKTLALFTSGNPRRSLRLYDLAAGKTLRTIPAPGDGAFEPAAALSPDAGSLAAVTGDQIWVWDLHKDGDARVPLAHPGMGRGVLVFAQDGKSLVSVSPSAGTAKVWEAPDWKEGQSLTWSAEESKATAVSPDGRTLARASGKTLKLQRLDSEKTAIFTADMDIYHVVFSRDGKRLLLTSWPDAKVQVLDAETGESLFTASAGPRSEFSGFGFGPDDRTVVTTGKDDGRILQWRSAENPTEWQLPGPIDDGTLVGEGRYLITSNRNGTVYVFRLK